MIARMPSVAGAVEPTFRMFRINYIQLNKALEYYQSPKSHHLWFDPDPTQFHSFYIIEEVIRLLHNYAASAMTLVTHTTNEARKLDHLEQLANFRNEYKEEINRRFAQNENHQLIQGLRNYMLHYSLVEGSNHWEWHREKGEKRTIGIQTEPLLKWKGWKPLAKQKIARAGKHIIIHDVVNQYFADIDSFHKWLWDWQGRMINSRILPI